jgi:integrase
MTFGEAIDRYIEDMRSQGRINSDRTEIGYRACLAAHADDVSNRDPRYTNKADVKRTLRRWANPNTQSTRRACLVSFYDWTMQELDPGRKDNPARQTVSPRRRKPTVYRFTRAETARYLQAATTARERRAAFLGVCAGVRRAELLGLQRRHFERPGWVWISADIGKGGRERWVPILPELAPVVDEILEHVGPTAWNARTHAWEGEYVLCAQRWRDPGRNRERVDLGHVPASPQALFYLVKRLGRRAGIVAEIGPHTMRHAFGDHVARYAGMRNAQFLLGHADVGTTEAYVGEPTLDELAAAVHGLSFTEQTPVLPPDGRARMPHKAPTGIEPVASPSRAVEPSAEHLGRVLLAHRAFFVKEGV